VDVQVAQRMERVTHVTGRDRTIVEAAVRVEEEAKALTAITADPPLPERFRPLMSAADRAVGIRELAKQIRGAENVGQALAGISSDIQAALGHPLTERQQRALDHLTMRVVVEGEGPTVGIPDVRREMADKQQEYRNKPGIPMRVWSERLSSEQLPVAIPEPSEETPNVTLGDQWDYLQTLHNDALSSPPEWWGRINLREEAWATSGRGGYLIDQIVAAIVETNNDQTGPLREQRERLNEGRSLDYTFDALLARGDTKNQEIYKHVIRQLLYHDDIETSPLALDMFVQLVDDVIQGLQQQQADDAAAKKVAAAQAAATAGGPVDQIMKLVEQTMAKAMPNI
jgi:hypothetical protein